MWREGQAPPLRQNMSLTAKLQFTQIVPQIPRYADFNFMQKNQNEFWKNSCNLKGSMV